MNPILKKICQFAKSGERDIQVASLRVLARLDAKDREVVALLGEILQKTADLGLRELVLDIPLKTGDIRYLPYIIPCLSDVSYQREKVIQAISTMGLVAIPQLEKRYAKALEYEKESILRILGKIPSRKSCVVLLAALSDNQQIDKLKLICALLKEHVTAFKKADRLWLKKALLKQASKAQIKRHEQILVSCLILLGYLRDPSLKSFFVKTLNGSPDLFVKKYALLALLQLGLVGKGHDDLLKNLLPTLNHSDFPNIVKNTISILERLDIQKKSQKEITKLLENPHPSVRSFALSKLGTFDSGENVTMLIGYLDSPDHRIREAAKSSLERMPKAAKSLLKRFESSTQINQMNQVIEVLKQHKKFFTPVLCRKLFLKIEKMLRSSNEICRMYLLLLRSANPDFLYKEVLQKVAGFKKKKKWESVIQYISFLEGSFLFNQDARYELAIARLKASKQDFTITYREQNPGLSLLQGLLKSNPDVVYKQLVKEKALDKKDRYYLGFHFSEKSFELRELGIKFLKSVSKSRDKIGKQAKQKLVMLAAV